MTKSSVPAEFYAIAFDDCRKRERAQTLINRRNNDALP